MMMRWVVKEKKAVRERRQGLEAMTDRGAVTDRRL